MVEDAERFREEGWGTATLNEETGPRKHGGSLAPTGGFRRPVWPGSVQASEAGGGERKAP